MGLWSVADGREYRALSHNGPERGGFDCFAPAIHPGGRLAVVQIGITSDQRTNAGMVLFDLETGRELAFVKAADGAGTPCFDGNGNLYTNGPLGVFRWPVRLDPQNPGRWQVGPREALPFPVKGDRSIATSRDGSVVAQATWGAGVWVLHPDAQEARQIGNGRVNHVAVSPDGAWVVPIPHQEVPDPWLRVFDPRTLTPVCRLKSYFSNPRFTADGQWLLTREETGGRAHAVPTWKAGPSLGPGVAECTSADGRMAVLRLPGGIYRLVEIASGRELARLEEPDQFSTPVAFTPDGTRLVLATEDGLRVWDFRLIRAELAKWDLDWDHATWPPFPARGETTSTSLDVNVQLSED